MRWSVLPVPIRPPNRLPPLERKCTAVRSKIWTACDRRRPRRMTSADQLLDNGGTDEATSARDEDTHIKVPRCKFAVRLQVPQRPSITHEGF